MIEEYTSLIKSFLDQELSVSEFITTYNEKFLNEKRHIGGQIFDELDWLFVKIDDFNPDSETFASEDGDVNEQQLHDCAKKALDNLAKIGA